MRDKITNRVKGGDASVKFPRVPKINPKKSKRKKSHVYTKYFPKYAWSLDNYPNKAVNTPLSKIDTLRRLQFPKLWQDMEEMTLFIPCNELKN